MSDDEGKIARFASGSRQFVRTYLRRDAQAYGREFPRALEKFMAERGMNQLQLAAELNVDDSTVWRWLRGVAVPDVNSQMTLLTYSDDKDLDRAIEKDRSRRTDRHAGARYDVFVASPIGPGGESLQQADSYTRPIFDAIVASGRTAYWAAEQMRDANDLDAPMQARTIAIHSLLGSIALVCAFPPSLGRASSVLVEIGMALAQRKPVTVVCEDPRELPSCFQQGAASTLLFFPQAFAPLQVVDREHFILYIAKRDPDFLHVF